jgi:ADP-ribose pyrophosphatase
VAVVDTPGEERRLVVTSEFRVPINCREVSFPAGLIDPEDYTDEASVCTAARRASVREMKEETGLDFTPTAVSPENLYSSAGMTNESVIIVFGVAQGTPSDEGNEACEDIATSLLTFAEMVEMMDNRKDVVYSKTAWPFLWAFKFSGGFTQGFPDVESGQPVGQGGTTSDHGS